MTTGTESPRIDDYDEVEPFRKEVPVFLKTAQLSGG